MSQNEISNIWKFTPNANGYSCNGECCFVIGCHQIFSLLLGRDFAPDKTDKERDKPIDRHIYIIQLETFVTYD